MVSVIIKNQGPFASELPLINSKETIGSPIGTTLISPTLGIS
jgi:hypothetical protein